MQSHPVKRVVSGALAAAAVIAAVTVTEPATASPIPAPAPQQPPSNTSEALQKYRELAAQAEKLNEDYLKAKDDLSARQADLDKASADLEAAQQSLAAAKEDEEHFRREVDKFADASFTSGAQLNKLSALLTGNSAQDFLDRSSALEVLAADKNNALSRLSGAVTQAADAQRQAADAQARAQTAKDEAAKLTADIEARKKALDDQLAELARANGLLTSADRAAQRDTGGPIPNVKAPGPAAQAAVDAALSKLGSSYVWGAEGPSTFDCSGLTSWAYKQAGISIPRSSRAQSAYGTPVSRNQLQPGDLVFFYSPVSHVGIYIGGGKMVHAPTSGDVVKISPLQAQYSGARRVA
ncbi:Cell wall-associated hydrolase, NlpC family [Amycolatopsis arida]|uniref:Cell wall-associated hydrolase, NlpC family n=1 Tax=Amycolatopsis arida TaxID=587909 RepID=A0A1I5XXH3_9PSEU|nr:C40 family peptidase [Amycolatopsis arida]TDX97210.1 cell wall-associated NlpC family hydrolase [Amycolatopsis arida]SFQ36570.1 Cell wall-associated hydrolase, NlpC family [Amycolatopsis arida]